MTTEYPTSVRLPDNIRRDFRKLARQNRRSLTRQIVLVLADYLEKNPLPAKAPKEEKPAES